ncbi:MAG: helix-turn-helix domain-containing protein [Candidatus Acidiferrum sp.]|jgi:cytoskeleton protein RodZ
MAKGSFGERLKREREMRDVSLDELTKSTRISQRFLEALENEDWSKLPGGVFGRGFVRTIAGYLGLDEETLLGEYDLARGAVSRSGPHKPEDRIPSTPLWIPIFAMLAICAVLAGLFFGGKYAWRRYSERRHGGPSSALLLPPQDPSAESSTPAATSAPPPPNAAAPDSNGAAKSDAPAFPSGEALDLSVSTSAATRVRILADDKLALDEELPAGINRHFAANERFEVTAADSSAVLLELNHQVMRPLGPPGASGTMVLSKNDLRPVTGGNSQP